MRATAPQIHEVTTREVAIVSVDCRGFLDDSELLTGTPTITAPGASGLVLSQKQVNASAITVNGAGLVAGEAVQFKADATAATAGQYELDVVCGTSSGQTRHGRIVLAVISGT